MRNRQIKFLGEREVTLVVRGHCHDGAGTVRHQDIVGYPDRDFFAVHGIDRHRTSPDAGLFFTQFRAFQVGFALRFVGVGEHCITLSGCCDLRQQRVLGRNHHIGGAIQGIRTGGEHAQLGVVSADIKGDFSAFAASNPVFLQALGGVRPIEILQTRD